jgi:alpha-N-arabinofuranosidase
MKTKIAFLLSLWLLSTVNITAQNDLPGGQRRGDIAPIRAARPARTPLASDAGNRVQSAARPFAESAPVPVAIDASTTISTIDARMPGINTAIWDSSFHSQTTITLLRAAGTSLLRYPGGSLSDEYHWKTNTSLNNTWTWATSFDDFASIAQAINNEAIITVNYGTGNPDEAADWVGYSNITKGYGFKFWEIGNENYGSWETDGRSIKHDPFTYGMEARDYIAKMKAVDPTIKIGVVVTAGEDSYANNTSHPATNPRTGVRHNGWTPVLLTTLKELGVVPDFVIYHRYEQNPGGESDSRLLQSAATWKNDAADLRRQLSDYLGSDGDGVELVCTENNSVSSNPGKQSTSIVNGLFLADSVANILQTEFKMFVWWDLGNGYTTGTNNSSSLYGWRNYGDYGITSTDDEPYPTYYVMRLLAKFARPGDSLVSATSQSSLLAAYATKRGDGTLNVLLINKSPDQDITAQLGLTGFVPSLSAVVSSYGRAQDEAARTLEGSPDVAESVLTGASQNFDYAVPAYSLRVISFLPTNGDFRLAISPSSQAITASETATFDVDAAFADGFQEPITLSAQVDDGAPLDVAIVQAGVSASQTGSLLVTPMAGGHPDAYSITLTGSAGGVDRTATINVTLLDPPVITSATYVGKKLTLTTTDPGPMPRVFVNGVDQTDKIKKRKGDQIVVKAKKKILGLNPGDNRVRIVKGQAASAEFLLRL